MTEEAKRVQVIRRKPVVSVQDAERFYLRMLLLRTGVISFNDLKTIAGTVYETFQEACKVLGLLDGDQHWHYTLLEAARMQMLTSARARVSQKEIIVSHVKNYWPSLNL
ncbi:hypothetical protein AVEN_262921-1 [Araneus ventricosus]|uniref:Uncharacterized protein n=1 Tax=Araneus ventricosus TaxID=182803 RepID=A0A4Y2DJK2_ARAVE|nr:hypothetical protein AVEN_262921-1 [Araneus ventricosus]